MQGFFGFLKWGLIIVSIVFFFVLLSNAQSSIHEAAAAAIACFGVILARLAQAEEHRLAQAQENKKQFEVIPQTGEKHKQAGASEKSPAIARAGEDEQVYILGNRAVHLDGSNSGVFNAQEVNYSWALKTPDGSSATLNGSDTVTPSFIPDIQGAYEATLTLTVKTGEAPASTSYSHTDTVTITAYD
tara:strand:+ start:1275 stop:1835 length:561 start_codon:yes stop_codon:yes gene_type:complete